jgi:putative transcriptional regulator
LSRATFLGPADSARSLLIDLADRIAYVILLASTFHMTAPDAACPFPVDEPMSRQPENFPEIVKEVRKKLGLSQKALAQALGVSFATVNRWENGRTMPSKLALRQFEQFCAKMTE